MTKGHIIIAIKASRFEDHDDSLAAAEDAACTHFRCRLYSMRPRWEDDSREYILLDIPAWAASPVLLERFQAAAVIRG